MAAQDIPDSGLPDASVGQGSAQQGTEENDPNNVPCIDSNTCSNGFQYVNTRCVPRPVKNVGCQAVPGAMLLGGLAFALRRRR